MMNCLFSKYKKVDTYDKEEIEDNNKERIYPTIEQRMESLKEFKIKFNEEKEFLLSLIKPVIIKFLNDSINKCIENYRNSFIFSAHKDILPLYMDRIKSFEKYDNSFIDFIFNYNLIMCFIVSELDFQIKILEKQGYLYSFEYCKYKHNEEIFIIRNRRIGEILPNEYFLR